ncbi:ArsR family transcriptional regulator [Natronolimnohabitans sp. A-GB9]|uniref:ArsR family transcriptional regulator n=1 Tax=Natronolimnohabitans sp. A-GB9 TaxID=3069757 RepID=UPI0027B80A0D|nr:ArsR family transcriptional regulator [Natronolimnohabitans sp. A-GB9]MDQ2050967.1 ArsR family transcriptional regulator [Natronolimnohabitans sp. A-GB9]
MHGTLLLAFGVVTGAVGVYLLVPGSRHRCNGPMAVVVLGVLSIGSIDPIVRALSIYSGHFFEALGALLILVGLFEPVRRNLSESDWAALFDTDHRSIRPREEWMDPMDDRILELLDETEIVLTPALLAYNIDYSREAVNRRLLELCERGFVDRVDHGKYRITPLGRRYLRCCDGEWQNESSAIDATPVGDD